MSVKNNTFLKTCLLFLIFSLETSSSFTQKLKSNEVQIDTVCIKSNHHQKIALLAALQFTSYGVLTAALYTSWYRDYPVSRFHFFNDNNEWLQVDKVGHVWSTYQEGRLAIQLWSLAGLRRSKAIWIGGMSGLAYQSVIEVLDGFSAQWGFSWGDYLANIAGAGTLILQELALDDQIAQIKFSSSPKRYPTDLRPQARNIYGSSALELLLKDYNAQTYWLSLNLRRMTGKPFNFPKWLNLAFGFGADGMLGAESNSWINSDGETINRNDIKRYRQWYVSFDLDWELIPTKNRLLRSVFFVLNSLKFPAPALEISKKKLAGHWVHF